MYESIKSLAVSLSYFLFNLIDFSIRTLTKDKDRMTDITLNGSVYCTHKVLICWVQDDFCSPHRKEKSLCVPSHCLLNFTHCIFYPDSISLVMQLERPQCVVESLTLMDGTEDHLFVQWRQGKLAQSCISFLIGPARLSPSVAHAEPDCWFWLA